MVDRARAATGADISSYKNKEHFSTAWEYMTTLEPDAVFLAGDNVYNDAIANWGQGYHPYGYNLAQLLYDGSVDYQRYHGYVSQDAKRAGPLYYSYLELLKDKVFDGFLNNEEFGALRNQTYDSIHVTWDDHDYMTNDPSNPHYLRHEFRKAEIEAITGWDRNYFRFNPAQKGIERSWTRQLSDPSGKPFLIRFIILDEETTQKGTRGCAYYQDAESPTGFTSRSSRDSSMPCPDVEVMDDFENPQRDYFGEDQLEWFRQELMKPADLTFVTTGGPNFESDYDYASLTEYPGDKRKLVEMMRETGAEHVIFLTGDSHNSYLTKVPHLVGYPLYTVVGSGLTEGLSYDRYVARWGDISHRFLVAAGSTNNNDPAATFAEVQVMFDDDHNPFVRFIPHLMPATYDDEGNVNGFGPEWYAQTEPNDDEPWAAQYDIYLSELEIAEDWPLYHYEDPPAHHFVTESIFFKWGNTTGLAEDVEVTLTITNAAGDEETFEIPLGATNCGEGFFGFCKDKWGAFTYLVTKKGTYAPSLHNQIISEFAGNIGDEIQWSIAENGVQVADGSITLKIRNNVLVNSDGEEEDLWHFGTQETAHREHMGIPVTKIIQEPPLYGGYTVPVRGWDGSSFDNAEVQAAYEAWVAANVTDDTAAIQAIYLNAYYPDLPKL